MNQARAWLPREVAERPAVRALIDDAVRRWADRWFARGRPSLSKAVLQPARPGSQKDDRRLHRAIGFQIRDEALNRLIDLALDAGVSPLAHTAADETLLTGFGDQLLEDLVAEVAATLGIESQTGLDDSFPGFPSRDELLVVVRAEGGGDLLALTIQFEDLIPACLSLLPRSPSSAKSLSSMASAVGDTTVILRADLGRAQMRLDDLAGLAPGDVLVLDRRLEDGVLLSVADTDQRVANARLSQADGQVALIVQA